MIAVGIGRVLGFLVILALLVFDVYFLEFLLVDVDLEFEAVLHAPELDCFVVAAADEHVRLLSTAIDLVDDVAVAIRPGACNIFQQLAAFTAPNVDRSLLARSFRAADYQALIDASESGRQYTIGLHVAIKSLDAFRLRCLG